MNIHYTSCLKKNNIIKYFKPNEDYLLIDVNKYLFVVADGVSRDLLDGKYPNPSPSAEISKLFCRTLQATFNFQNSDKLIRSSLIEAVTHANSEIKSYNYNNQCTNFLPGTVAIIGVLNKYRFHYCYVGDCSGYLVRDNKIRKFTNSQSILIKQHKTEFSATYIRNNICNNSEHKYGYGVFTGQESALKFLDIGAFDLESNDKVILTSDGVDNIFEKTDLTRIINGEANDIVKYSEGLEMNSKDKSDDKSIIVISLSE